jgi:molybdate transport system substrate-binding protein
MTRVLALLMLLAGSAVAAAEELLVFGAASLTDALTTIGRSYPAHVQFAFGASNDLARQIRAGAPADVFFSADVEQVAALEKEGLVVPDTRRDVLSNVLVVIVPRASTLEITGPTDLTKAKRLSLANPDGVPAGKYARAWLQSKGVWEEVADRVVPAVDVRAALAGVGSGNLDAGIVYRTDAAITQDVKIAYEVPRTEGPQIVYALAAVKASKQPDAAANLAAALAAPEAMTVYERFGFVPIPAR